MTEKLKNPTINTEEENKEQEEINPLLRSVCEEIEIEPTDKNLDFITRIIAGETKRQELLEYRKEQMESTDILKESLDKERAEIKSKTTLARLALKRKIRAKEKVDERYLHDSIHSEWNAQLEAEYLRRDNCELIGEMLKYTNKIPPEADIKSQWLLEEDFRRQILASPSTKQLSKKNKRFAKSYQEYQKPTDKDLKLVQFDEYYSSRR